MPVLDIKGTVKVYSAARPGGGTKSAGVGDEGLVGIPQSSVREKIEEGVKSGKWVGFSLDLSGSNPLKNLLNTLDKSLEKLEKVSAVLTTIMKFIQLFLSSFNSFSRILSSLIDFAETEINKWTSDIAGAGVFFNPLFPPSFVKSVASADMKRLSTGGFAGFLKRLQVSLYNRNDPHRPVFSSDAEVGGLIILIDSESPSAFFKALEQLANLFDFINLIPLNISPPPPVNIRARSRLKDGKYEVRLDWDAPNIRPSLISYRISRSAFSGGIPRYTQEVPAKLGGRDGFLHALSVRLSTFFAGLAARRAGKKEASLGDWPVRVVYEYDDRKPGFAPSNPITGGGYFIDDQIPQKDDGEPVHYQYYYVIESGYGDERGWVGGPRSSEIVVPIEKKCIDPDLAAVIEHEKGFKEYVSYSVSSGSASLGRWYSIQAKFVMPIIPPLINMLNKFIKMLKGMIKNTTDSFSDFIEGIKEKFETYAFMVSLMSTLLQKMQDIVLNQSVAFLYLKPEKGGVKNFMTRVRNAKPPSGGFSGPNGFTGGLVFMYGQYSSDPMGSNDQKKIEEQTKAISKSFDILMKFLTGGK